MAVVSERVFEIFVGAFFGVVAFFGKRTLANYDRRIRDTEMKQDEILKALNAIDKKIVELATILEFMKRG
jgi:hypothetical protein